MNNYTQYDWASDRQARMTWADEEDRLFTRIDKRLQNGRKKNHKKRRR